MNFSGPWCTSTKPLPKTVPSLSPINLYRIVIHELLAIQVCWAISPNWQLYLMLGIDTRLEKNLCASQDHVVSKYPCTTWSPLCSSPRLYNVSLRSSYLWNGFSCHSEWEGLEWGHRSKAAKLASSYGGGMRRERCKVQEGTEIQQNSQHAALRRFHT